MTRLARDERGAAVTVWAVAVVTVITMIAGIAVDLSGHLAAKRLVGDLAEEAARVAGQHLDVTDFRRAGRQQVRLASARQAVTDYLARAGATGTLRTVGTDLEVTARTTYRPVLLQVIGVGDLVVTATATTRMIAVEE